MKSFLACILLLVFSTVAQQSSMAPATGAQAAVQFSFDWPQGIPWQSYSIKVQLDGKSHFDGAPHGDELNDTDLVEQDFTMSEVNRLKVFALAQKLNYFRGDFDSHLKHIAQTGKKTLQYQSPQVNGSTTFNWSKDADIEELAHFFQGVAQTIEYGRLLAFQYRFDKLGMDQRMKELEDLQSSHGVEELAIIAPILHKIADDPNLMNISRESAKRLLATFEPAAAVSQNASHQ